MQFSQHSEELEFIVTTQTLPLVISSNVTLCNLFAFRLELFFNNSSCLSLVLLATYGQSHLAGLFTVLHWFSCTFPNFIDICICWYLAWKSLQIIFWRNRSSLLLYPRNTAHHLSRLLPSINQKSLKNSKESWGQILRPSSTSKRDKSCLSRWLEILWM